MTEPQSFHQFAIYRKKMQSKRITRPRFELGLRESKSLVLTVTLPGKERAKVITWNEIARSMMVGNFVGV